MEPRLVCLLDTSVLIDYFRKSKKEKAYLFKLAQKYDHFYASVITQFEIYSGSTPEQREFWDQFFGELTVLEFDSFCSLAAARIFKELKRKNKLIGIQDLLIGATALVHELPVATLNQKEFNRIDGLKVVEQ